ncbi:NifB/NifX family molybdenum-iron cluster-binding protein [Alistipes sp. ZOR0009]|jgi:predicted Fe-Mo cluster-binding NifX family protein|uniref:NifB/NifX family molybdenum-iron cluster-binding protein n=1 Tax=Alistipes sp. ZOR0009 TaxID=1339253 RepID=UPI0006488040|nr:NifB/NifX family molybdenum-iron cluster-binding protein [Alistipes sp. ZOR0009]
MKIALPTRGEKIDDHFGHCEKYTVITVDENRQIVKTEIIPSPQGCGCKSNIASELQAQGVTIMLAGNMGGGALNVLTNHGIAVVRGCSGLVLEVAQAWLEGQLADSGVGCSHHQEDGHNCKH